MARTATKRSTKRSTTTQTELPGMAPAAPATAVATAPSLVDTLVLKELFRDDGTITRRDLFRFNKVTGGVYAYRRAVFIKLSLAAPEEIMVFPRPARNAMFSLCQGETKRYYGTAIRRQDNPETGAKAGDPLPQLQFDTRTRAVEYRNAIQAAMKNLQLAVFGPQS